MNPNDYFCENKILQMNSKIIKLPQAKLNKDNPRTITKENFNKLINSLLVFPRMMSIRPVVLNEKMQVIGGNMRTHALKDIAKMTIEDIADRLNGIADFATKIDSERKALVKYWDDWLANPTIEVVMADGLTDAEKRQFVIKDNAPFGQWDYDNLANNWDNNLLEDWGVDVWPDKADEFDDQQGDHQQSDGMDSGEEENNSENENQEDNIFLCESPNVISQLNMMNMKAGKFAMVSRNTGEGKQQILLLYTGSLKSIMNNYPDLSLIGKSKEKEE